MLIVNTDHGFLVGEHDWWAKVVQPWFQEVAHIPLWIYDPRQPHTGGQKRQALVQTIDFCPTVLGFFGVARTEHMEGTDLFQTIASDQVVHPDGAIFGVHGGQVNFVDSTGRWIYMRGCADESNSPLWEHTLMPTRMVGFFDTEQLSTWAPCD